jgi:hypothetical protein
VRQLQLGVAWGCSVEAGIEAVWRPGSDRRRGYVGAGRWLACGPAVWTSDNDSGADLRCLPGGGGGSHATYVTMWLVRGRNHHRYT